MAIGADGTYGYNAVLRALALAARRTLSVLLGVLLSIALTQAMLGAGLPPLTFPFILSAWIVTARGRNHGDGAIRSGPSSP